MTDELTFRPFEPRDLDGLILNFGQAGEQDMLALPFPADAYHPALSETAVRRGAPVGAAGIMPLLPHRAVAWAYVGVRVRRRDWPAITARVAGVLDRAHAAGFKRIEATARFGVPEAGRWLRRLGFACETPVPMPLYGADGEAYFLFSRIRL